MEKTALNQLRVGETARVTQLAAVGDLRRRLQDIGLIIGTIVDCIGKSPGGDPKAYYIRGAVIALRQEDAAVIFVEKCTGEGGVHG